MTPSFGLCLLLGGAGLIVGAALKHPVFGAFCGLCIGLGIVWSLGDDE